MKHIVDYCTTMAIVRSMLEQRIISFEEFVQIDELIREKYSVSNGTVFRDIRLIGLETRDNMPH